MEEDWNLKGYRMVARIFFNDSRRELLTTLEVGASKEV